MVRKSKKIKKQREVTTDIKDLQRITTNAIKKITYLIKWTIQDICINSKLKQIFETESGRTIKYKQTIHQ